MVTKLMESGAVARTTGGYLVARASPNESVPGDSSDSGSPVESWPLHASRVAGLSVSEEMALIFEKEDNR
jgi:hypothetical protein